MYAKSMFFHEAGRVPTAQIQYALICSALPDKADFASIAPWCNIADFWTNLLHAIHNALVFKCMQTVHNLLCC